MAIQSGTHLGPYEIVSAFRARLTAYVLLLGLIFTGSTGCYETQRSKERAIARGKALFEMHCCGCHNGKRTDLAKMPPDLAGIFRQPHLPSGVPATDSAVRSMMLAPRSDIMPSFEDSLSDQEIGDIIRYLRTVGPETHLCTATRSVIR